MFEAKTSMELFLLEPFTSYMIVLGLMFPARRESKEGKQLEREMQKIGDHKWQSLKRQGKTIRCERGKL